MGFWGTSLSNKPTYIELKHHQIFKTVTPYNFEKKKHFISCLLFCFLYFSLYLAEWCEYFTGLKSILGCFGSISPQPWSTVTASKVEQIVQSLQPLHQLKVAWLNYVHPHVFFEFYPPSYPTYLSIFLIIPGLLMVHFWWDSDIFFLLSHTMKFSNLIFTGLHSRHSHEKLFISMNYNHCSFGFHACLYNIICVWFSSFLKNNWENHESPETNS